MEIGSLVEQCDGSAVRRVGTVRALDETEVVVEWQGGGSDHLPVPVPESVRVLAPGAIRYKAATDLAALQGEFESDPVKVLVELLRELGELVNITALRKHVEDMGLVVNKSLNWRRLGESLSAHPEVRKTTKGMRWDGGGTEPSSSAPQWSASEALRKLVDKSAKPTEPKRPLFDAVSAGLAELSPYELLAVHALDIPVTEWPRRWTEPHPERVPEEIRAIAVEHILDMSRVRKRVVLPGTKPIPASKKAAEIPSSLDLLPLLVPLVAMPAPSLAADRAAKALGGEQAWDALRAGMECFEQVLSTSSGSEDTRAQEERLAPLSTRARELLKTVLKRRPKEDDLPWLDFAEEMAFRACALLADPRIQEQWNGLVREWAQHVADHSGIPVELREAARTAQAAAAAEAADAAKADGTGDDERTKEGRQTEAAPEAPTVSAKEPESTGVEEGGGTDAEADEADSTEPANTAIATDETLREVTEDAPDKTPEAVQEPERDPQAEIESLKRLLEQERSNAEAARAELERQRRTASDALAEAEATANRLRLRIADEEKHRADAETRTRAAEATAESARQGLEEAEQRVEAMTRQLRRRDDELRQSRQTARGASQAQLRQARIDTLRVLAAVLAEVADQAVHEGEETGPANALYRRALAQAAAAGVLDVGVLGEETDYDPEIHRAPGGPAPRVVVERPGFTWQGPRESGPIVLEQAIVRRVEQ
ncbi:hypothetical protein AB0D65_24040 [Streptomyces griseoloalbus]|uniref:Nucleotide exchange factor GrpE n=1 Tax=Streptomyces griseoloalbus TaxID=67303 RepID=A0ABV3EBP2_9ACTN